jgi:aminomethyltransferase
LSPTLGYPIAMAYVARDVAEPGTTLSVDVRGRAATVDVVSLPFYKRPSTKG